MPIAEVNGVALYYEIHGEGPNLALIEGVGYDSWMWYRQIPAFSQHFRTLVYDNRGVGRSDKPPGPYTHEMNAADLTGLLDHLGWDRTHVLGYSMGGFIAQVFALTWPDRLDRLVLGGTGFGGPNMVPVPADALSAMTPDPTLTPEQRFRRAMPVAFGDRDWPERHEDEFERIIRMRLEHVQPAEAAMAQIMANLAFDVERCVHEIAAPTLIIAGEKDNVVPTENARLLAARLPHARLDIVPDAGHLVFIEQHERFNADVIAFLSDDWDA